MVLESSLGSYVASLRYPDAKVFREIVSALAEILDEALIVLESGGLRVSGMDPAKVAYIEVNIPRDSFLEYSLEGDRFEIGVNAGLLEDMLRRTRKGDPISIKANDESVVFEVDTGIVRRYLVPNLELSLEAPEGIRLEHDSHSTLISEPVKRAFRDVEVAGDMVELESDEDKLAIRSAGEESRRAETLFTRDSPSLLYHEVKGPSRSVYDLSYIKEVINLANISDTIDIKFSTDKPLELLFKSPDGSSIRYLLAPSTA